MGRTNRERAGYTAVSKAVTADRFDGFTNLVTALGTLRDSRTHTYFVPDIVNDSMALGLWRGNDICKRIVEAEADAAFRRGIRLKFDDKAIAEKVGAALEDLELVEKFVQACHYEKAYGGAAIFPVIDDVGSLEEELEDNATFSKIRAFHVLEPRELFPASYYDDINDAKFRQPKVWYFIPLGANALVTMQKIHESRLITFPGQRVSNQNQVGQRPGWGDSALTGPWEIVRDFGQAWGHVGAILKDFSAGVLSMQGYAKLMKEKGGPAAVAARMKVFSEFLSSIRMGVMDKDDTYARTTTPMGGLSDILHDYATRVAASAGQPVTVLFGMAPAGLNATGDNDVRGWYDTVAAWREHHVKRRFERAVEIFLRSQESPTNGNIPDVWSVEFPPLWEPSESEQATTRKTIAETDQIYYTMGAATAKTIAESRWKGDTFSGEMHIDWEERKAQEETENQMAEEARDRELAAATGVDATGAPIAGAGAAPGAAADVQKTALNGAQIAAMLDVVKAAVNGEISWETAQVALEVGFQMSTADANRMLGDRTFKPTPKVVAPSPFGPKPPVPPAPKDPPPGVPTDDDQDEAAPKAA